MLHRIFTMLRSRIIKSYYSGSLRFSGVRCSRFAVNTRTLSSVSDAVKAEVKAENEDISTMDRCMKRIRESQFETVLPLDFSVSAGERADPAYHT